MKDSCSFGFSKDPKPRATETETETETETVILEDFMRTVFLIFIFALTTAPLIAQKHPTSKHKRPTPASASALPPAAVAAMASIDPQRIRAHVKFLSSDLLEGRGTGQRGGDIAAEYIATQFESYGLKPAGDNGAFLQKVPMVGITTEPSTNIYLLQAGKTEKLKLGDEIVAMDETQNAADDLDADLVFACLSRAWAASGIRCAFGAHNLATYE